MKLIQYQMASKIGSIYLVASPKGLQGVFWQKQPIDLIKKLHSSDTAEKIILNTVKQLEEYFAGRRREFHIVVDFDGTPFQNSVWRALSKIPFGKTVAYKDIAKTIKNPKAVRAVGTANGRNPFSIIVPCHRVIAADGSIGGYGGGVSIKRQLLDIEKN